MTAQPHLTALIFAAVIAAGALHAVWNAIAKHLDDRLMAFAVIGIPMTVVGGLAVTVTGLPGRTAVYLAVASAAISETSVIFAALIGMVFLKEHFGARRVAAAAVIAAGIVLIST